MSSNSQSLTTLKTNLQLAITRLKLLQKKKTELSQKTRMNIKDFIVGGKLERAKILAEHIIREDYLIESLEMVEMYCDLLLVRFDLLTQVKELDEGLREAVASLIWVTPRIQSDIPEIKIICDLLMMRFGRVLPEKSRLDVSKQVNRKLQNKFLIQCPSRMLVENYLLEIASSFNIEYNNRQDLEDYGSTTANPVKSEDNSKCFGMVKTRDHPTDEASGSGNYKYVDTLSYNNFFTTKPETDLPPSYSSVSDDDRIANMGRLGNNSYDQEDVLQLPSVPCHNPDLTSDDIIDDITKRFQALKKK